MALILKGRARLKGSTVINRLPYSVGEFVPELVADFKNEYYRKSSESTTFSGLITHTRASTATYVDSTGTLQTAAINQPRLGHHVWNGSAWVNEGLLHESEARTNLVTQSEDFSSGGWYLVSPSLTTNTSAAPDGATTADRLVEGSTTTTYSVRLNPTIVPSTTYTISVFVKAGSGAERALRVDFSNSAFSNGFRVLFNPTTGLITASEKFGLGTILSTSAEFAGNGWYRVSVTGTVDATETSGRFVIYMQSNLTSFSASYTGDGSSNLLLWGAQLEAAPTPSSYIPTSGSTVTRSADVLTIPAANLPYPEPVVIGPELVTNGDFSDGTNDWLTIHGVISVVDGALRVEEDGVNISSPKGYQGIATEIGKVYRATADLVGLNIALSGSLVASTNTNTGGFPFAAVSSGTAELIFVAQATTTNILLAAGTSTAGAYADWDNISVREINPLAVSIQMDGRVTYADTDSFDTVRFNLWQADGNNRIMQRLDTNSARTGKPVALQSFAGTNFVAVGADAHYSPSVFTPFNIASRHGSTFINGAVDGVAFTANTTPTSLPNLSTTNLTLGSTYNGTIRTFRMWGQDIQNQGLVEATS